jgi:Ras-related protein Rab-1A
LIGDSGTGKSCLLIRFAENIFSDYYVSTIGVDFKIKTVQANGRTVKLQVWDTAGQERFRTITSSYYRGSHGIIVVYDMTNRDSFEHINYWMKEIDRLATPECCRCLVGNKADLAEKRVVSTEEGRALANRYGVPFMETSARANTHIDQVFLSLASTMERQRATGGGGTRAGAAVPITPAVADSSKPGCC